jgi:hypothetical protein
MVSVEGIVELLGWKIEDWRRHLWQLCFGGIFAFGWGMMKIKGRREGRSERVDFEGKNMEDAGTFERDFGEN